MKKIAQSFGVNVKGVGTGELVSRITKEIAVGNKDNLPGPMSDSDRRFLVDMAPGLSQSPDGNRMIIELGMLSKQYEVARAQAARQYAASNGGRLDSGFYSKLSEVDAVYGDQFGNLMSKLRSVAPTAPKSVDAGFPTARNPKTGERIIFRDGQWMPAQ